MTGKTPLLWVANASIKQADERLHPPFLAPVDRQLLAPVYRQRRDLFRRRHALDMRFLCLAQSHSVVQHNH